MNSVEDTYISTSITGVDLSGAEVWYVTCSTRMEDFLVLDSTTYKIAACEELLDGMYRHTLVEQKKLSAEDFVGVKGKKVGGNVRANKPYWRGCERW